MRNADIIHASALAALPEIGSDGALPADIQVFPPGCGVRFTLQDYPGKEFEIDVTPETAEKLDADLQALRARANSGAGSAPFADKNHEDAEATFTPVRYFWGGNDPKTGGVRLVPDWIPFGAALVRAKAFKYFSQNFLFSQARKKVLGLINENVGGLVNRPGFATQAAFAKAASPIKTNNEEIMTTEDANKIGAAITAALAPLLEKGGILPAHATALSGKDGFMREVIACEAKGMTTEQAARAVGYSHPDLFAAYRAAMVFSGGIPIVKATAKASETAAVAREGHDEFIREVMAAHAGGTSLDQAAQTIARTRPDLFAAYRVAILRAR